MFSLAYGGRPKKRERMRGINGDILEEKIFVEGKIFWKRLEFWKLENPLA